MCHTAEWTSERVERLWNFYNTYPATQDGYFSRQFWRAILGLVQRLVTPSGTVMDVGCGPGYLLDELLRTGLVCKAIDISPPAIHQVQERFAGRPGPPLRSVVNSVGINPNGCLSSLPVPMRRLPDVRLAKHRVHQRIP